MKHCKFCNAPLTSRRQIDFCSPSCAMKQAHKDGKVKGKRFESSGGKVTVNCTTCGKPYEIWRYQLKNKRHFCSDECYSKGQSGSRGGSVDLICAWCGKSYTKWKSQITQNDKRRVHAKQSLPYCSPECQSKGLSNLYSPEERSGYIDGRTGNETYIGFSPSLKKEIKQRDGYNCRLCGSNRNLHVHHIDHNTNNNDPSNLITLCQSCNVKERWHREIYEPLIRRILRAILGI